jgi:hypothetical protein
MNNIGGTITFGKYKGAPIVWRILDERDWQQLLLSEYCLDSKPYNNRDTNAGWAGCSLRKWLNNEFFSQAFSASEKRRICETLVTNKDPEYGNRNSRDTRDMVFALSRAEAEAYFNSDAQRVCKPAKSALSAGALTNKDGCCWWWLRCSGGSACFKTDGGVNSSVTRFTSI